jgi:TolB-like protein/Flp pilus assembly protein TadD
MFTDVEGYTALAQRNEQLALKLLEEHRTLLRNCLRKHGGREVKTMGDAFLVEFPSALEAVKCALRIQETLNESNASRPPQNRLALRVGIHVGDVVHSKGDIYGDAVNIASRIEPLAGPGEIFITQQVYDHIGNKIENPVGYLGKRKLKNVEVPVDVYRLSPDQAKAPRPAPSTTVGHRLVVLPLANISPNPGDEYFADGMTEEFISSVSKVGGIRVISRTSSMKYKGSTKTAKEIARELNVDTALEGSVRKAGNKVRISVQLIDVQNDEQVWAQSYDREFEDIFAIQSDIASSVADALKVSLLASEKESIDERATENIAAYNLYLKGLHYRAEETEVGLRRAIRYFNQALRKDPKFALAYSGLADCYAKLSEEGAMPAPKGYPKAKALALKALGLDRNLPGAHATLGAVLQDYEWDLRGAEKEFKLSLRLNPNFGKVCNSYGALLACEGRFEEAIAEIERAKQLNPLALDVNNCAAVIYNCVNQHEKSLQTCQLMLRIDEDYFPAFQDMGETYLNKSMFTEGIEALNRALELSNGAATVRGRLGYAYAVSGNVNQAKKILLELERDSQKKYVSPVAFALVCCGLGDKEEAVEWLERAYKGHAGGLLSLKVRPIWSSLRPIPRFRRLLKKMGLEE